MGITLATVTGLFSDASYLAGEEYLRVNHILELRPSTFTAMYAFSITLNL